MKKEWWLVIIVLILAVVGYYFMFVSETPLFGPTLVRTGTVARTGGGVSVLPIFEEDIGIGVLRRCNKECGGCTHCAFTCSLACPMDDIEDCCKNQPKDLQICAPDECLYGANGRDDSYAIISDDWSCCNGRCFNPRGKDNIMFNADDEACCGPAGTYKTSEKQCCVADELTPQIYKILSQHECCKMHIFCEAGLKNMLTSCKDAPEPCGLAMAPEVANCLGLTCDAWYSRDYLSDLPTPNPLPYACSDTPFLNSFFNCALEHELNHAASCDPPPPICRDEINAFSVSIACIDNLPCSPGQECDFLQENLDEQRDHINMAACVCTFIESSGSIGMSDCKTCLETYDLYNKDTCQQYCRKNRIGESPPAYCNTFPAS